MKNNEKLEYYLGLKYPIEITELLPEDGGGYFVCIPLLGRYSVNGYGESREEALDCLEEVKRDQFATWINENIPIPEPTKEETEYSGRFVLRVPPFVHRTLALNAQTNSISLNTYVLQLILQALQENKISEEITQQIDNLFEKLSNVEWSENHVHYHFLEERERLRAKKSTDGKKVVGLWDFSTSECKGVIS